MKRCFTLLLLLVLTIGPRAVAHDARECVVLMHGVALSGWAMSPLGRALEKEGYRVVNLSYPSRTLPIETIAREWLPEALRTARVETSPRVHFVVHSMGSLVTRLYLREQRPANLGRVVMLGPPNHGSLAADHASRHALMRWIIGVNLPRLGGGPEAFALTLGPVNYDVGVIAGSTHLNPLFDHVLAGVHDGVVTLESAQLDGMRDFIVVPHSHTAMLWRSAVHAQVIAFLRRGEFAR